MGRTGSILKAGDPIYFLSDYDWIPAKVMKVNAKSVKLEFVARHAWGKTFTKNVPHEKVAHSDEVVCVVWEMWKGKNGRGGYRVERELYPESRVPARDVCFQHYGKGRVNEDHPLKDLE